MNIMEIKNKTKPYFSQGEDDVKIGFIFPYPSSKAKLEGKPIYGQFGVSFNNLLCKLNRRYPLLFPYSNWSHYRITSIYPQELSYEKQLNDLNIIGSEMNLKRLKEEIKDLETIICFGEKAYFAVIKTMKSHNLSMKVIKVRNIAPNNVSRSIKILAKKPVPRVRTDYLVLDIYQTIVKNLS